MSETISLIGSLEELAQSVVNTSSVLVSICRSIEDNNRQLESQISALTKSEERSDSIFEIVGERIMSVEFLNINPDNLLDIARHIDEISDVVERAGFLFQYLEKFQDQEMTILLIDGAIQVQKITVQVVECLMRLGTGNGNIREISEVLSEREKAVDALREDFNSRLVSSKDEITFDQKIWLKDIFANFDQIADLGRDLGILFRVVDAKLSKQRTLTLKQGTLRK